MLGDGQQLHMGKPLIHNVIRQLTSKLAVAESRPPRTEMDFVGAHRLVHRVAQRTPSHPVVVTPGVVTDVTRDAVCGGTSVPNANGSARSVTTPSAPCTRNLYRPSQGKSGQNNSHTLMGRAPAWGFVAIPTVELADQADALGVGRPHGERHATHHTVGRGKRAGWAPRTSQSRSWRPSANRCRSTSPRVGRNRYASATVCGSQPS